MRILFVMLFSASSLFSQVNKGFLFEFKDSVMSHEEIKHFISDKTSFSVMDVVMLKSQKRALVSLLQEIDETRIGGFIEMLSNDSRISFVSAVKVLPNQSFLADLPQVFIRLKSKDLSGLFLDFLKQHTITEYQQDQYIPEVICVSIRHNRDQILKEILALSYVEYLSRDQLFSIQACVAVNDTFYPRQWALSNEGTSLQGGGTPDADMDVDSAWTITTGDPSIKIAIIDSGTDTLHPDLIDNLLPGFDATGNNSGGYPGVDFADDGHGTCTAGIAAASGDNSMGISGVAYNCKIIPVRMFTYINYLGQIVPYSTTQMGVDAMNWAAFTAKADVLSNSWGIRATEIPLLGIDTMYSNDVIENIVNNGREGLGLATFFSAGNDPDTFSIWPATLPFTISVGATSMCDELKTASDCSPEGWGSNHGYALDISAPGVRIAATDVQASEGFTPSSYFYYFNGTSASCPLAAGVGALMLSVNPEMSANMLRQMLSETCDKVGGYVYDSLMTYGTWSMELGYGRINAYQAVKKAQQSIGISEVNPVLNSRIFVSYDMSTESKKLHIYVSQKSFIEVEVLDVMGRVLDREQFYDDSLVLPLPKGFSQTLSIARVKINNQWVSCKF